VSKIETGRFSELLRRMLGQKGQEIVAAELSPEVSPTIQLEGPAPEWDFLKGVRDCRMLVVFPAAAGFVATARLRNPAASGVIATILHVHMAILTQANVSLRLGALGTDLANVSNTVVPDTRWSSAGATDSALRGSDNGAADAIGPAGDAVLQEAIPAAGRIDYPHPWVMMPGASLDIGCTNANVAFQAWILWTERALPALEV